MRKTLCIGALVLSMAGAFWYGKQAKPEPKYAPVVQKAPEPDYVMNMGPEAMQYFRQGMERMRSVGVEYSSLQVKVMFECANRNNPGEKRLDADEAKELYESVLNPDSVLGRMAVKEALPSRQLVKMPAHYEPLLAHLIDYNNDGVVSKEEVKQAHYKVR